MTWIKFCELFTILNLFLLAFATVVALLVGFWLLIDKIVDFVKKINEYFDNLDDLDERFERSDKFYYNRIIAIENEFKKMKKGSKKK